MIGSDPGRSIGEHSYLAVGLVRTAACAHLWRGAAYRGRMPSTVIRHIRYEPGSSRLIVVFVSGRTYAYEDVPADIFEAFRAAPSRGAYFNEWIRDRYDCTYLA
jgi:hypothetical protein